MPHPGMEAILVHLVAGAINIPVIVPDPIQSCHHSSSVMAATAMQKDRLGCRIVEDLEQGVYLIGAWPRPVAHSNPEELHSGSLYIALLGPIAFHLQIDYDLDSESCQVLIILPLRLGSAV